MAFKQPILSGPEINLETFGYTQFHRFYKDNIPFSRFIRRNKIDFSRDIIKEPNLTIFFPELSHYFPKAKYLFIVRDPRDNIRSMLNRWKIPGNLATLEKRYTNHMPLGRKLVLDCQWLGFEGENYIEILAFRWVFFADIFLRNRGRIISFRYEDFIKDKAAEIGRLAEAFGLSKVNDISKNVDFQFQPRGDREITWEEFYGLRNLRCIEEICKDKMLCFGYSVSF